MTAAERARAACAAALTMAVCACGSTVDKPGEPSDTPTTAHEVIQRLTSGSCMPHVLHADADGRLPCLVVEATHADPCACDPAAGRGPLTDPGVEAFIASDELTGGNAFECLCEIVQLDDGPLTTCQNDPAAGSSVDGWCYIDALVSPPLGNPELVAQCHDLERRGLRFVGEGVFGEGAIGYLACAEEALGVSGSDSE